MAGEKRTQDQEETLLSQSTILVDIEGTTTSISFVKETLFPYVRENLKKYIDSKWEDEEFKKDLEKLKEQAKKDEEDKVEGFVSIAGATADEEKESLIKNVLWQMDGDRKTGALKQLQGHMWREAYNSGAIKGHVFEDVPTALESWTNGGRKVYVYSSGSVEAQKLLFGHSVSGDLLKYFSGYYDTEVGGKQESSSYKSIVGKIGVEASTAIFLTDIIKEAKAAKEAGLSAVVVVREGNAPLTDEEKAEFTTIKSLLDLTFQTSSKRQKLESASVEENGNKTGKVASEPMDTTEDVEMADVSEKKTEKTESKEAVESNTKDKAEPEAPSASAEEPMVTDAKEKETEKEAGKTEAQTNNSEVSKPVDTPETVQAAKTDDAKSTPTTEKDSAVSEKPTDKPMEVEKVATPTPAEAKDKSDVDTCKSKSKTEETTETNSTEEKKAEKIEDVKKTEGPKTQEKSTDKKEEKTESKTEVSEKPSDKPAESTPSKPVEEKPASKATAEPAKTEESSAKDVAKDAAKNGDVPVTDVEKVAAPTIPESEAKEAKDAVATETKTETKAAEAADVKSPKAKESETPAAEKPESNTDSTKQESKEEPVKNETVDEVNDKSTVDPEKKKLNGTTRNGDKEVSVSDDKLHSNGLKEGSSEEKLSSVKENTSAQNGEPESSSEASAESIKVKKVVDSTVTDGAGEPDVVPPVVVAATS